MFREYGKVQNGYSEFFVAGIQLSPCVVPWFFTPASPTVISPPAGAPVWNTVPLKGSIPSLGTGWGRTLSGAAPEGCRSAAAAFFTPPLRPLDILGLALSSVWVLLACPPRRAPSCILPEEPRRSYRLRGLGESWLEPRGSLSHDISE